MCKSPPTRSSLGAIELAKQIIGDFAGKRIARQIETDGRQPRELARTQSWHYAIFNLEAMFNASAIGDRLGIDLWNFQSTDQRGIRPALDWLLPFASGERTWTEKQLSPFLPEKTRAAFAPRVTALSRAGLRESAGQTTEPQARRALATIVRNHGIAKEIGAGFKPAPSVICRGNCG